LTVEIKLLDLFSILDIKLMYHRGKIPLKHIEKEGKNKKPNDEDNDFFYTLQSIE
jgi:hypothetical protein